MLLKQIRIPKNNAVEIMNELGKIEDSIEFLDLTANDREAKKNYGQIVKRCDDAEKLIM